MHESLGDVILERARVAQIAVVIAAPFIKAAALKRVLADVRRDASLTVITRWVPEEIAAGVSDLEAWDLIRERKEAELRLFPGLHAKYFRFDGEVLVGSANVTAKALGWAPRPNLEILVPVRADQLSDFEAALLARSFEVDEATAEAMRAAAAVVPASRMAIGDDDASVHEWFPRTRHVEHLYDCYLGHEGDLISSVFIDGVADLKDLHVSPGLSRAAFAQFIASRLQQLSYVAAIDARAVAALDRPHGQALLRDLGVAPDSPACQEWDRLANWLAEFLPFRFRMKQLWSGPALERSRLVR